MLLLILTLQIELKVCAYSLDVVSCII